jgi:hypothetical protein
MSDNVKDENKLEYDKTLKNVSLFDNLIGLFSNNHHVFIVRKSERLASALYVITGFMPPDEPIRTRLRVCALEIITHSASPYELQGNGAERFEFCCGEIVTILQTARYSGLISEMNARLVSEEYASLAAFVREHAEKISERGHLLQRSSVSASKAARSSIGQNVKSLLKITSKTGRIGSENPKDRFESRKNIILKIFNTKDSISIKDAVSFIPAVSEKTIQRDLISLVASGFLTKSGSRRWTMYRKAEVQSQS